MRFLLWLGSWDFRVGFLLKAPLPLVASNCSQQFLDRSASVFSAEKTSPRFNPFKSHLKKRKTHHLKVLHFSWLQFWNDFRTGMLEHSSLEVDFQLIGRLLR